jgi:hypothetical protein
MQRTPLVSRVNNNANMGMQPAPAWAPRLNPIHNHNTHSHSHSYGSNNRQQFPAPRSVNPPRTNSISDGSDSGMGAHPRPPRLSTLASHNSWPNGGANVSTRGECRSVLKGSNITHFPKPNRQGDSDLRPSTTQNDDERGCQDFQLIDKQNSSTLVSVTYTRETGVKTMRFEAFGISMCIPFSIITMHIAL